MRLQDKVAVITGGGSGIGEATARRFAAEGAKVFVLDVDETGARNVVAAIEAAGGLADFQKTNIAREAEVEAAFARVIDRFGRVDVLVNNAAVFVMKGLEATVEDWQLSVGVNVIGTALCSRFAAADMKKQGRGAIVNLGSISSFIGQPGLLSYSATKAAIVQMTRNMALDLAPFGIRVNCVCPGPIWTPALRRVVADRGLSTEEYVKGENPRTLLNRIGQPDEVASAILFLASDEASYITGTPLMVDGGYTVL